MLLPTTELVPSGDTIDALTMVEAGEAMVKAQQAAVAVVSKAMPALIAGADAMADAIRSQNSIIYAAAGSSALMALADASELPGTFGVPANAIQFHMAGGVPSDGHMPGHTEDNTSDALNAVKSVGAGDVFIALSASGTTPYAIAAVTAAKAKGCTVIGIANNPNTPLLDLADIPICLKTPPEIIAGSTRLGAGTAQKVALNLMSSLMGVQLGHVYQGMMVNVVADNKKLKKRAAGIVAHIASVPFATAELALQQANGKLKLAILIAHGCSLKAAEELLETHKGHLGPCIDLTNKTKIKTSN